MDDREAIPVLLEWPPPGTEAIHGKLSRLRVRSLISVALILPALVSVLFPAPTISSTNALLLLAAALGLFVFLSVITACAGLFDVARKAIQLGYPRRLLFEIALDRARDTQSLVAGIGRYDILRERTRLRVRSLRTWAAAMLFAAAVLPLPLLCVALLLALRAAADPIAFVLIPALPFFFLTVTAAILNAYAAVLVHWDRGADVWDPSPVTSSERASEWLAVQGIVNASVSSPPQRSGSVLVGAAITLVSVAIFVFAATVIAVSLGAGTVMQVQRGNIYIPTSRHAAEAELVRYLRVPRDSSITAHEAGVALHSLLFATGQGSDGMIQPARVYTRALWSRNVPYMDPSAFWKIIIDGSDVGWFAPEARAAFDSILRAPHHPALAELAVLAHAPAIDVAGTRYPETASPASIGKDLYANQDLWRAATVDAATTFRDGDVSGAETKLLNMISAGFQLIDGSPFDADLATGAALVVAGRDGLSFVYHKTGRADVARVMEQMRLGFGRAMSSAGVLPFGTRPYGATQLWTLAGLRGPYPAVRWTAFQSAVTLARCNSLRSILFGPSDGDQRRMVEAENSLVHSRADSLLLRAALGDTIQIRRPPRRPGIRRLISVVRLVLTDHHVNSPCLGAFTTRF